MLHTINTKALDLCVDNTLNKILQLKLEKLQP